MSRAPARRTNDPEALRRRVLDAAAEAFQSRGYHAASMQEIMRDAGVTGGALHHHYPTKKSLGLAVIAERVAAEVRDTWIEPVSLAPSAADGVAMVFAHVADGLGSAGPVRGCPLNNLAIELSLADPEFRAALAGVFEDWRQAIAGRLRADQDAGESGPADPEAIATLVVAAFSGAMAQAKTDQNPAAVIACGRELERLLRAL